MIHGNRAAEQTPWIEHVWSAPQSSPPDRIPAVYNQDGNERWQRAVRAHPDRSISTCSVNPWYGKASIVRNRGGGSGRRTNAGAAPIVEGYFLQTMNWSSRSSRRQPKKESGLCPYRAAGQSTPWQIVDLADGFPKPDLIMGHCGATDFWNDVPDATASAPNIYLESSLARPFHFARYMEVLGKGRGIRGSWAPLNDLSFEWEQMRTFIPPDVFSEICGTNLARLLAKRGAI